MHKKLKDQLKLDSREWHEQLGNLMSAVNHANFPAVLVSTLKSIVPFDHSVFFAFHGQERPICLYDTFTPKQRIVMVDDYQEGPFLLDPFCMACHDTTKRGLYRLRDIAPDRFYHSEYYRTYYRRTELSEEISFIISLPDDLGLSISLMRASPRSNFSERDIAKLRRAEPIILAAASLHWNTLGQEHRTNVERGTHPPSFNMHLTASFENFGTGVLTRREREVVGMVLRGHSSESIGKQSGITTGTVKIHRKNIYAKLDISSQSELFSLFISQLSNEQHPTEHTPS